MRHTPPSGAATADEEGFRPPPRGPFVLPGDYRVELRVGGGSPQVQTVHVNGDPLIKLSDADRRSWHDTLMGLVEMQNIVTAALSTTEQLARQVAASRESVRGATPAVVRQASAVGEEVDAILRGIRGAPPRGVAEQPTSVSLNDRIRQWYSESRRPPACRPPTSSA